MEVTAREIPGRRDIAVDPLKIGHARLVRLLEAFLLLGGLRRARRGKVLRQALIFIEIPRLAGRRAKAPAAAWLSAPRLRARQAAAGEVVAALQTAARYLSSTLDE
jgi:hypothetical protein